MKTKRLTCTINAIVTWILIKMVHAQTLLNNHEDDIKGLSRSFGRVSKDKISVDPFARGFTGSIPLPLS